MKIAVNWRALLTTIASLLAGCVGLAAVVPLILYSLSANADLAFLVQIIAVKATALACIVLAYLALASGRDFLAAFARTMR